MRVPDRQGSWTLLSGEEGPIRRPIQGEVHHLGWFARQTGHVRVSAERVLSGPGLVTVHGRPIRHYTAQWPDNSLTQAPNTTVALQKRDPLARPVTDFLAAGWAVWQMIRPSHLESGEVYSWAGGSPPLGRCPV